jgi:hypothetical protein
MPYQLDMAAAIDGVLHNPDLKRELANPAVQIGEAFLKRELLAQSTEMESELGREVQAYLEAEQAVEDQLAFYQPKSARYNLSLSYGLGAAFLISIPYLLELLGVALPAGLEEAIDLDNPGRVKYIVIGVYVILLLQITIKFSFLVRNRRLAARKRGDKNLETAELKLTDVASEIELRLTDVILRAAIATINSAGSPFFQNRLILTEDGGDPPGERISSPTGLTEVSNPAHEADTVARRALTSLLEAQPGGSIGISGPRGSGKSTLLRSLTAGNLLLRGKRTVSVYSAAPVDYDPRDFLLHLFASLCRQVLLTHGVSEDRRKVIAMIREYREWEMRRPNGADSFGWIFLIGGVAAASLGLFIATATNQSQPPWLRALELKPGYLLLYGLVSAVFGLFMLWERFRSRRRAMPLPISAGSTIALTPEEQEDSLIPKSLDELDEIHFQRSFTSGWSGAIKMPVGFDWATSGGMSLVQRQESLPELVDRFRRYVEEVVREHGAVVIAIDELDKIKEPAEAEEFVNEIKSIFGISDCFYLISVSEDAMSSFERRGLALRDAFDSAFDEIRYLDYADLGGARKILQRRVLNLPDPFLCLCYVLSGGLPRDLIRIARSMFQLIAEENPVPATLGSLAAALIELEVTAKIRASKTAARGVGAEPETSLFLTELANVDGTPIIGSLSGIADRLAVSPRPAKEADSDAARLAKLVAIQRELSAYLEFLDLTLHLANLMDTMPGWQTATTTGVVDQLARARQGFESNVGAGLARLALVRNILSVA